MLDSPIVHREFIYETAPFPSCHASTLVETPDHTLVAAWFGGTHESASDVGIYAARRAHGRWTPPFRIADGVEDGVPFACYNPVLYQAPHGPLLLFYKFGTGPQNWHGRLSRSMDGGKTWSAPANLPAGVFGPIKNKPIFIPPATLLCGSSTEDHGWRVRFESTTDFGQTWTLGEFVNDGKTLGAIQPAILAMGGSHLRAVGRTQQGAVFAVDSEDNGRTWGPMRLLDVPNPNCGVDAVRLRDGRYLLVYNATTHGRSPLDVAVSTDAEHWRHACELEHRDGGEFSYPAVIQTEDGYVHITYTWERKRIAHVVIDPSRLP